MRPAVRGRNAALLIAVLGLGMLLGAAAQRSSTSAGVPAHDRAEETRSSTATVGEGCRPAASHRNPVDVPRARPVASADVRDPSTQRDYRAHQSEQVLKLMLSRVDAAMSVVPGGNAEAAAAMVRDYQRGIVDGYLRTTPDLIDELAEQVEQQLCRPDTPTSHLVSMARLIGDVPELAGEAGFDCVFSDRAREDVVLWTMLDAWRNAQLPKTPAMARLEQTTTDERIRARFAEQAVFAAGAAVNRAKVGYDEPPSNATVERANMQSR